MRGLRATATVMIGGLAALALSACPGPRPDDVTTKVDRDRADVLRTEPILASAVKRPTVEVGKVLNDTLGWDRTMASATIFNRDRGDPPPVPTADQFEARVAGSLRTLRDSGWSVLWTECRPPAPRDPGSRVSPDSDIWEWAAVGYKINNGVSYGFSLRSSFQRTGSGSIGINLQAPNHRDPDNLYPDAPPSLNPGTTCIEQSGVGAQLEHNGTYVRIDDRHAWPRRSRTPDPSYR